MLNFNRHAAQRVPVATASPALETIERWLRGLTGTEIRELGQALTHRNAECLARFHIRFQAWLERTGQ
jgi:hypothetical protein